MKCFNCYRIRFTLFLLVVAIVFSNSTRADFSFGEPVNLETTIPILDSEYDAIMSLSYDGLEMYIISNRPGGYGDWDLWVLNRTSQNEDWNSPKNLGSAVNSSSSEGEASISADGLALYFCSDRPEGYGYYDIYVTTRKTKNDPWGQPINLGAKINSSTVDSEPWITGDGLELYFHSFDRAGGYGLNDIYVSRRATLNDPWTDAVNLGPLINTTGRDLYPCVSADGLLLFFSNTLKSPFRTGGYGYSDMWMARRTTVSEPWQEPVNLGSNVNSALYEVTPRVSPDGSTLYFYTMDEAGVFENWQASIKPKVDLNSDGIVDSADMCILVDYWGTNEPLCDIGPMPWGDGVVDIQDLIILAEHLFEEIPPSELIE